MFNIVTGGLSASDVAKLDALPKIHFGAYTVDTITVSTNAMAPSYVTGVTLSPTGSAEIAIADAATGAVVNNSDRAITMQGTVTYQVDNGTGGTAQLLVWSERSDDNGVTWTLNDNSLRTSEVSNTSASSQTKSAAIADWQPGQWNRFVFANVGAGSLTLDSPSATVAGGVVGGFSFFFALVEV